MADYCYCCIIIAAVDVFVNIINNRLSSAEINRQMLKNFASKIAIWEFSKVTKSKYDNFSKEDKNVLLVRY